MKLSTLFTISLAFIPSLITAVAIPDVASRNETLAKRGGEVNYLANCERIDRYTGQYPHYPASYMAWYSNGDNSQGGQRPDSLSNEYRDWSNGGTYLHWEGQQHNIHFPDSGVTVETHIDADAQSRAFTAYAGYVYRPADGKTFNCYKDNGRGLFDWSPPVPDQSTYAIVCTSIYWCV